MTVAPWVEQYVGLPFRDNGRDRAGLDCWGLLRLVLAEKFDVAVESYAGDYQSTLHAAQLLRVADLEIGHWLPVLPGQEQAGDAVCLRMGAYATHVGLCLGGGYMLHIERGIDSCVEKYTGQKWKHRIKGIYRHGSRGQ